PERAGLTGQHRNVMPRVVDRLVAAEIARMLANDGAILADDDALGISLDLDRPADGPRSDREFVVVEARQAGLGNRGLRRAEAVKPAAERHQLRALGLEDLPDRPIG